MSQAEIMREIEEVLIKEVRSDSVGLWTVLWEVRRRLPSLTAQEARAAVFAIIRHALERRTVLPGEFVGMRFVPWETTPTEAMERIEKAWLALGREPNIGEVAWFIAPELPS